MTRTTQFGRKVPLGELIAAAYDRASDVTSDSRSAAKVATMALRHILARRANRRLMHKLSLTQW